MKVTDTDSQSFIRNLVELNIKKKYLPEDFVISEKSVDVLFSIMDSHMQRDNFSSVENIQIVIAYAFVRGYAEGKYHG
jgi:hypothetical protein